MENVYKTPESKLVDETNSQNIDYQLYKISGIGIATFFGSLMAGGVLLGINFRKLGKHDAAKKALIFSAVATLALLILAFVIPENWNIPNAVYTVVQIVVMVQIAKQQQEVAINTHVQNGGALASNWKAFGISLLVLLGVLVVVFPLAFLFVSLQG